MPVRNLGESLEWVAGYKILDFRGVVQAGNRHLRMFSVL